MDLASQKGPATLGDVLYPDKSTPRPLEEEWVRLVQAVGRDDALALQALYEKAHRPVFTLAMRIIGKRAAADEATLDAFDDVWRLAASYTTAHGTVLGWIMNLARSRAIERRETGEDAAKDQSSALNAALAVLAPEERSAIEEAFFSRRDAVSPLVSSALHKLGRAFAEQAQKPWPDHRSPCGKGELACAHALQALPGDEGPRFEAHLQSCWQCRREIDALRPVIDTFAAWPTDVLRPPVPLQTRLAARVAAAARGDSLLHRGALEPEPQWGQVAPGISCKLLATDTERHMVSMLVRLVPGGNYPAHTHAGLEELHLLAGELWIDERKLYPGDYNRAEPGSGDKRVWSETGCACVLVTSTKDVLS